MTADQLGHAPIALPLLFKLLSFADIFGHAAKVAAYHNHARPREGRAEKYLLIHGLQVRRWRLRHVHSHCVDQDKSGYPRWIFHRYMQGDPAAKRMPDEIDRVDPNRIEELQHDLGIVPN